VAFPAGRNMAGRSIVMTDNASLTHFRHFSMQLMSKYHRLKQIFELIQDNHFWSFCRSMGTHFLGKARTGPETRVLFGGSKTDMAVTAGCVWKEFMNRLIFLSDDTGNDKKNVNA